MRPQRSPVCGWPPSLGALRDTTSWKTCRRRPLRARWHSIRGARGFCFPSLTWDPLLPKTGDIPARPAIIPSTFRILTVGR
jgi:hypothetical protein